MNQLAAVNLRLTYG